MAKLTTIPLGIVNGPREHSSEQILSVLDNAQKCKTQQKFEVTL